MTSARGARAFPLASLLVAWGLMFVVLIFISRAGIMSRSGNDPDDWLRLLQVRDFIAGQSWFDLTQHRVDPPIGLPMHWSRLVDIPLVAFIVGLKPLVGAIWAERIAITAVPGLTLLVLMLAVVLMIRRLFGAAQPFAIILALLLLTAPIVQSQLYPTRIDHHGWQIAMAASALAALLDRRELRSGVWAGTTLGIYLAISVEGLPFVIAVCGGCGLLWALGYERGVRLVALTSSLAITAALAFALATPGDWSTRYCDQVVPGHLAGLSAAAFAIGLIARFADTTRMRIVGGVLVATCAFGAFATIAPQCVGSPFGTMDPVVYKLWYQNVSEGLPVWKQQPMVVASVTVFPLMGLLGLMTGARNARGRETKRRWMLMVLVGSAATLTGLLVIRAGGVATVTVLPGAFAIMLWLRERVEVRARYPFKPVAGVAAMIALCPLVPVVAAEIVSPSKTPVGRTDRYGTRAFCDRVCGLRQLPAEPPTRFLAGLDLGPFVIGNTPHRVFAAGYHRLQGPIRRTIEIFTSGTEAAEPMVRQTGAHYVLVEPESDESGLYRKLSPRGLMAHLTAGRIPAWLEPVPMATPELRLFRVRPVRVPRLPLEPPRG